MSYQMEVSEPSWQVAHAVYRPHVGLSPHWLVYFCKNILVLNHNHIIIIDHLLIPYLLTIVFDIHYIIGHISLEWNVSTTYEIYM